MNERLDYVYLREPGASWAGLAEALFAADPGVTDAVPAYDSLFVEFDAARTNAARVRSTVRNLLRTESAAVDSRTVTIPVAYGGEYGIDLAEVAARAGLEPSAAAALHASRTYDVVALGFSPGFPFLSGVPEALRAPRRSSPRARVPAHSVAIANHQSGIYPQASPGGWNLIGAALTAVYDPEREEPFLLRPGDRLRFVPTEGEPPPAPRAVSLLPEEPDLPVLRTLATGLLDLVVDAGRMRAARFGLARSGPLDAPAASLANRLVGNAPGASVLELTLTGPEFEVLADCVAVVTGGGMTPCVNGALVESGRSFALRRGDRLGFRPRPVGSRAYLAIAGAIESRRFMGSASVDLRGSVGRPLAVGDVIGRATARVSVPGRSFSPHRPGAGPGAPLRVRLRPGPQAHADALAQLTSGVYEVGRSDRTGLRLGGPRVPGGEITSEGVMLGGVQVTPSGEPIVLLADRGTIGGYSKPAVVLGSDLALLAQLRLGESVRFVLV